MRFRLRLLTLALVAMAAVALLTAACGGDDDNGGSATNTPAASKTGGATSTGGSSAAENVTVTAEDFSFDKTAITAKAGQTVNITFKNNGNVEHSFTVGSTDVTEAEGGDEKSGSFTASSSTTEFHCKYHPSQMKGTITISG